jgi:hypothetical protein
VENRLRRGLRGIPVAFLRWRFECMLGPAYDHARETVVLYGGADTKDPIFDTQEYGPDK